MLQAHDRLREMLLRRRLHDVPVEHGHGDRHAAGQDHIAAIEGGRAADLHRVLEKAAAAIVAILDRHMAQVRSRQHGAAALDFARKPRQLVLG